jgi:hypothetical protein
VQGPALSRHTITRATFARVLLLAHIICPVKVVVIAGSTRGLCAQFAERIITIGSQHTNINICAQVEVIARHTSSGSPRAEKEVIVFGETGIIHCAGIGIIAGCEQNDSDLTQSKYSHSCASIDTKSVTLNIDVTPVNRMTVT